MDIITTKQSSDQTMTSLEISELTGKSHAHLMRDIRKMEPAWEKVSQSKFGLTYYLDKQNKQQPMYELSKTECLYIATKFNDEARARLILRWQELEERPMSVLDYMEKSVKALRQQETRIENIESEIKDIKKKVEYKDQNQRFLEIENGRLWQKQDIKDLYN